MISFIQHRVFTLSRLASFVAIFSLFLMTVGDAHVLRCLDGQELSISLHFENLQGDHLEGHGLENGYLGEHLAHSEEREEGSHNDYEYEIETNTLQAKFNKLNDSLLLDSSPGVVLSPSSQYYSYSRLRYSFKDANFSAVLPPPRAPPVIIV